MIISKTPFRISFFGGGTDFEKYFRYHGGQVIGSTIDKYCYITLRSLPPFFNHKNRIVWSRIELVNSFKKIYHPTVRNIFLQKKYQLESGLEVHHQGDLPANSGIGSSSSFSVGLINAITKYKNYKISKKKLAQDSIDLEVNKMRENVGYQDQVWAAYGGMNIIKFHKDRSFEVKKIKIKKRFVKQLEKNLALFFIGNHRFSGKIEKKKQDAIYKKINVYHRIKEQVDECNKIFQSGENLDDFGLLLNDYWKLKKSLTQGVSNKIIDDFYDDALSHGALGGKLIGSGGGGFLLLYSKNIKKLKERYKNKVSVSFKFTDEGSKIIYAS